MWNTYLDTYLPTHLHFAWIDVILQSLTSILIFDINVYIRAIKVESQGMWSVRYDSTTNCECIN